MRIILLVFSLIMYTGCGQVNTGKGIDKSASIGVSETDKDSESERLTDGIVSAPPAENLPVETDSSLAEPPVVQPPQQVLVIEERIIAQNIGQMLDDQNPEVSINFMHSEGRITKIKMNIYDADFAGEGQMFINDINPITLFQDTGLFPVNSTPDTEYTPNNEVSTEVEFVLSDIQSNSFVVGINTLTFNWSTSAGFGLNSIIVVSEKLMDAPTP